MASDDAVTLVPGDESVPPAPFRAEHGDDVTGVGRDRNRRSVRIALWSVLATPVLANLAAIVGYVKYQPQVKSSGLETILQKGIVPGQPYIDPNVGYNTYAVGHAAALSWLHGVVPWWNFNEGLGTPLAGSIQSAAFFPLTLLMALSNGVMWFHLGLELVMGLATFCLLRELKCSPFASAVGAIAFSLNGSAAWLTNAPVDPVPFLPVLILGIEWSLRAAGARRRGGWILLAVGVWLTIVAGFPEVAVMNIGLAIGWLVFRLVQRHRETLRSLLRVATGGVVGLLLAAPLLNVFVRAYKTGDLGFHNLALVDLSLPRLGLAQMVSPFIYGGIFDSTNKDVIVLWGREGGYVGVTLLVLALGGAFGRRERWMRVLLAAWATVFLGYIYDVPVLHQLVENLPGITHAAVFRYVTSSVLFCLCVLAAFCIDDLRALSPAALVRRIAPGCALVIGVFAIGFFSDPGARHWTHLHLPKWYWGSLAILALTLLAIAGSVVIGARMGKGRGGRFAAIALGTILAVEMFGFFEGPILAFPRQVATDNSVVAFLRDNLGYQRYFTIGPAAPNYGAFYGIASLDESDLPAPKVWTRFVHHQLNPCILPWQLGNGSPTAGCEPAIFEFVAHARTYEEAGVKYFVLGERHLLSTFEQPSYGAGARTPDGAATMSMTLRPPGFWPGGVIRAFTVQVSGSLPAGMTTTVCASAECASAVPDLNVSVVGPMIGSGVTFELSAPIRATNRLSIVMHASFADNVSLYTAPSSPVVASTVLVNGTVLPDRSVIVKFLYTPSSIPRLVHQSPTANIYELTNPSPIGTAAGCSVTQTATTSFDVDCARASTLVYRELAYAGWHATVKAMSAKITTADHVFQSVPVPAGRSTVSFSYEPPQALWMWLAMLLGVLAIAASILRQRFDLALPFEQRRARRDRARATGSTAPRTPEPPVSAGSMPASDAAASDAPGATA